MPLKVNILYSPFFILNSLYQKSYSQRLLLLSLHRFAKTSFLDKRWTVDPTSLAAGEQLHSNILTFLQTHMFLTGKYKYSVVVIQESPISSLPFFFSLSFLFLPLLPLIFQSEKFEVLFKFSFSIIKFGFFYVTVSYIVSFL